MVKKKVQIGKIKLWRVKNRGESILKCTVLYVKVLSWKFRSGVSARLCANSRSVRIQEVSDDNLIQ
jgi:hypothetical protein